MTVVTKYAACRLTNGYMHRYGAERLERPGAHSLKASPMKANPRLRRQRSVVGTSL